LQRFAPLTREVPAAPGPLATSVGGDPDAERGDEHHVGLVAFALRLVGKLGGRESG
jgi:hypothetical protein